MLYKWQIILFIIEKKSNTNDVLYFLEEIIKSTRNLNLIQPIKLFSKYNCWE